MHISKFVLFFSFVFIFISLSCKEAILDSPNENLAPDTQLSLDTVRTTQTTQMTLHWSGDDPDGTVLGYLYSLDSARTWNFTTETTKQVTIPTLGFDSLITKILVASVDNSGNGKFDASVIYNSQNIGSEYYTDSDHSGTYSSGETYYDYGAIDQTPASFFVRVKNGPPVASFNTSATIPALTAPIATFILQVDDPDGIFGVEHFEIALNDTASAAWIEIPKFTEILTLKGDMTDTISTTMSAEILTGFEAKSTGIFIPNLKVNSNNRLYFRVKDNTGTVSDIATMPDSTKNWFVTKPQSAGNLLLIRNHYTYTSGNPDQDVIQSALALTPTATAGKFYNKVDVLYLNRQGSKNAYIPKLIQNTMVQVTLNSFKKAIWYGGDSTYYGLAQNIIPKFLSHGGKIFFRGGFGGDLTAQDKESLDFLPIESLNTTYYYSDGKTYSGFSRTIYNASRIITIVRDQTNSTFPVPKPDIAFFNTLPDSLALNNSPSPVANLGTYFSFIPNQNAFVLYRLSFPKIQGPPPSPNLINYDWPFNVAVYKGSGTPVVMAENTDRNLVFTTVPFNYFSKQLPGYPKIVDGKNFSNPLPELLYQILSVEFERP